MQIKDLKMMFNIMTRSLSTGNSCWSSTNKTLLAKLRKKTGYTFANCKKALELHNNNIEEAEKWLKAQAQALGWSKATKLEGRPTLQGLVALTVDGRNAAMVELNCETDFVARNKNFVSLAELAVRTCLDFTNKQSTIQQVTKMCLDNERLKTLPVNDGKTLADHLALLIGTVGENLALRRAVCFHVGTDVKLAGYAHPAPPLDTRILLGRYGAILAFKQNSPPSLEGLPKEHIGRQLCQHIVGMNPEKIGEVGEDTPAENPDDEHCMIFQEYLLDPSVIVNQVLGDSGISLLDFTRFECGETSTGVIPQEKEEAVEIGG
ncbi:elongation factor Ts, mitochondrial [Schistocerca cancellata]|uniref:elongation factor Ts, mitochondrial n=1 Tax=Schistocerca cancellata TaxID=274614 RepID=UPI0021183346|nr:elongation factor Ts, mitochondrial [Schistocerca cancellata]